MNRPLRLATLALMVFGLAGAALAQTPPPGRWRCYQPPSYVVLAWFDLGADNIAVDGNAPLPVRFEGGRLALPVAALPPYREGLYLPPAATQGDAERHTLVLSRTPGRPAGGRGWDALPRCYMTTH